MPLIKKNKRFWHQVCTVTEFQSQNIGIESVRIISASWKTSVLPRDDELNPSDAPVHISSECHNLPGFSRSTYSSAQQWRAPRLLCPPLVLVVPGT